MMIINLQCSSDYQLQKETGFDSRYPLPGDSNTEYIYVEKEIRFLPVKMSHYYHYDIEAVFNSEMVEPFVINQVLVNGVSLKEYRVCNNGQYNFLNRANGVEAFYAKWKSDKEYLIQVLGKSPNGTNVKLEVFGKAPEEYEPGTLEFRGKIPFRRPISAFTYFHVRATFFPQQYEPVGNYRLLGSIYYNYSFGLKGIGYGSPEQIRNIENMDKMLRNPLLKKVSN